MFTKKIEVLAASAELYQLADKIGKKFNLNIDQIGELDAEIREFIRGKIKAEDFVLNLTNYLEIDKDIATQIATEADDEIFSRLKDQLRNEANSNISNTPMDMTANTTPISAVEKAGGFEIVNHESQQETDSLKSHLKNPALAAYFQTNKVNILENEHFTEQNKIEDKKPLAPQNQTANREEHIDLVSESPNLKTTPPQSHKIEPPNNLPGKITVIGMTDVRTDALVDHLLGQVASAIQEKISKKEFPVSTDPMPISNNPQSRSQAPNIPINPRSQINETPKVPGQDPYLEPIS